MFVVSNSCRRPDLLTETCRFLSLPVPDFLLYTQVHTLPHLFGSCNRVVLDRLGELLDQKVSDMFLNASSDILSYVFMLPGPEEERASEFVLNVLTQAANQAEIALANVVRSCIVPLLANLVIAMGSDDLKRLESVSTCPIDSKFYIQTRLWIG